jgi:hypothetical protein
MYAHLVLPDDGRVFYTGGQYGGNNGVRPSIWDTATGQRTEVLGLTDPALRNKSASVLLPPAQDQRVMILGGGGVRHAQSRTQARGHPHRRSDRSGTGLSGRCADGPPAHAFERRHPARPHRGGHWGIGDGGNGARIPETRADL